MFSFKPLSLCSLRVGSGLLSRLNNYFLILKSTKEHSPLFVCAASDLHLNTRSHEIVVAFQLSVPRLFPISHLPKS